MGGAHGRAPDWSVARTNGVAAGSGAASRDPPDRARRSAPRALETASLVATNVHPPDYGRGAGPCRAKASAPPHVAGR
eukprot:2667353-Pyramimonas_sp.AAC.1